MFSSDIQSSYLNKLEAGMEEGRLQKCLDTSNSHPGGRG